MSGTDSKKCTRCLQVFSLDGFHRDKATRDGRDPRCKTCCSAAGRAHYKRNSERLKAQRREAFARDPERYAAHDKAYRARHPERLAARERARRAHHPKKVRARDALQYQVKAGHVIKPTTCSSCGGTFEKKEIQGHHEDYDKPLSVIWLCQSCHSAIHHEQ